MGTVLAHPRPESYCVEWVALKYDAREGVTPAKRLLKGTPWSIYVVVGDTADPYLVLTHEQQTWPVHHGEWVVRSPHDRVWVMSDSEFNSQFTYSPES